MLASDGAEGTEATRLEATRRSGGARARDRLREMYGPAAVNEPHGDPVHELVLTILSQNTSDTNRDVAYAGLRARFDPGRRSAMPRAAAVEEAIRPGGLAPTKAPRIQAVVGSWATRSSWSGFARRRGTRPSTT